MTGQFGERQFIYADINIKNSHLNFVLKSNAVF